MKKYLQNLFTKLDMYPTKINPDLVVRLNTKNILAALTWQPAWNQRMLKATRGGGYLNKVCLPLGGTRGNCKDTLHLPHIIQAFINNGGEAIGVLQLGGLKSEEGKVQPSVLLDGQHPGDIADEGTSLPSLLQGQLYQNKIPHLRKKRNKRKLNKTE